MAAGRHKPVFRFNRTAAGMSAGMLALAVVGLGFPALFHALHPEATAGRELRLSELVAIILVLTYGASLWFSLRTHHRVFGGDPHPTTTHVWGVPLAVGVLLAATAATAVQAEILVHATEAVTAGSGISELFLGLIVIPLRAGSDAGAVRWTTLEELATLDTTEGLEPMIRRALAMNAQRLTEETVR